MKTEKKKGYTLYTNTKGTTYHVKDGDSISLDEIKQQMALKESAADTKLDLITYDACIDKGFCEEGINIFGRILGLDDDEIKNVSFTQREFDNVVSKYGKLILKSDVWMEVFQLTTREAWKDHEGIISEDVYYSYYYAKDMLKGRFELSEKGITKSAHYSYYYAKDVLKGRFELGELVISENYQQSYLYARDVLKGRFELGESVIIQNAKHSYFYARDVIKGRFELGEKIISESSHYSYLYVKDIIKERFKLGEKIISEDVYYSYCYAKDVLKGRFELGEKIISQNDYYSKEYNEFLEGLTK